VIRIKRAHVLVRLLQSHCAYPQRRELQQWASDHDRERRRLTEPRRVGGLHGAAVVKPFQKATGCRCIRSTPARPTRW